MDKLAHASIMQRRFFRFSYHAPQKKGRDLRPHQLRDGAAFAELAAVLSSQGYYYGGRLLNYPADNSSETDSPDLSF
jgi:hypothetical protein